MEYAQPKYNGDPTIKSIANGLGTLGRYGDSYMVHAAEGETVVPAEILDANPELKQHLFWQMRMMGIKDPNRYVVGNALNSINPDTGQPEFWFKKIWKKVKKVFKKVLPVIAPIIGNLIMPGLGGIIASGLVTKLQGGSWGDVLKSAALSYGIGALGQGIGGAVSGTGFVSGLGKGLSAPFTAASNLFSSGPLNPLAQGIFGPGGMNAIFSGSGATPTGFTLPGAAAPLGSKTIGYSGGLFPTYNPGIPVPSGPGASRPRLPSSSPPPPPPGSNLPNQQILRSPYNPPPPPPPVPTSAQVPTSTLNQTVVQDPTTFGYRTEAGPPHQYNPPQVSTPAGDRSILGRVAFGPDRVAALGDAGAYVAQNYGGEILTSGTTAALGYFLTDDPDDLPDDDKPLPGTAKANAYDEYLKRGRLKDAEGIRLLREAGIAPVQDAQAIATSTGISLEDAQAFIDSYYGSEAADLSGTTVPAGLENVVSGQSSAIQPITLQSQPVAIGSQDFNTQLPLGLAPVAAARGGIVSLQGGGEITGPGTGTSDSIPARLSDGEFVMTADAVRGAGNGNRNLGAARMYDMMSRYERGVA